MRARWIYALSMLVVAGLGVGCTKCDDPKLQVTNNTAGTCQIYLDGGFIVTLGAGNVHSQEIKDGSHTVSADCSSNSVTDKVDCGDTWVVTIQ